MPINQSQIETMIQLSNPANMSGRKMWVMDGANMATAVQWFRKITGVEFNLFTARQSPSGFRFLTIDDGDLGVKVTLRGGSSSILDGAWVPPDNTYDPRAALAKPAYRLTDPANPKSSGTEPILGTTGKTKNKPLTWGDIVAGDPNPHDGPPTLEIENAEKLKLVPSFTPFLDSAKPVRVEVKFTTRRDQTPVTVK
jgi:hypothetical protein